MKRPINQTPKMDSLGRRLSNLPQSSGKRIELTESDVRLFHFYHRHGDLPVTLAFQYLKALGLARDYQSTVKRHGRLFHESNNSHGGPYLDRDPNQWKTKNADFHPRTHRLTERGVRVLKEEGLFEAATPKSSSSWRHDYLRACISASMEIECLRCPDTYQYISHPEIVERIGTDEFTVEGRRLVPDLIHGVRYCEDNTVRLFMGEIDCKTEQVKKSAKNSHHTFENKLDRYRKFIGGGIYKDAMGIKGGVMLQVVTVNRGHMSELMGLVDNKNYMLFSCVENFDWGFIPPKDVIPSFSELWLRPGNSDFYINSPTGQLRIA